MKFAWMGIFFAVLIWSGIGPKDYFTWALEVAPAVIGFILIAVTYQSFRLTHLLYSLVLAHCVVLMVGGHYTYAEVPLFDYLKTAFSLERNNYDKLGHFMQGFVPAILAREILVRKNVLSPGVWLNLFVLSLCVAFSAVYEIIEWAVAVMTGESAEAFLGTQGYEWDTQTDMLYAFIGAALALISLARVHDRQIKTLLK